MRRVAALLRAVNVGGRQLAMADFRALLAAEGFADPQTLLASGNAVFGTGDFPATVESRLEAALAERVGLSTDVLVRDAPQLAAVLAANPFPEAARELPSRLLVTFLRGEPQAHVDVLASCCTQGETAALGPGCIYLTYPAGVGVSKLTLTVIERRLSVKGTARNWNTVSKLAERVSG